MYIDMQTNKGTGQRIRKEKPNRAKMGWGVLTPTSQGGTSEVSNCPQSNWTDQPLLHPFLWVLLSRLIHCRQHQHSLAWLCPPPNGMRRSRPSGFSLPPLAEGGPSPLCDPGKQLSPLQAVPAGTEQEPHKCQKNEADQNRMSRALKTKWSLELWPTKIGQNLDSKLKKGECLIKQT